LKDKLKLHITHFYYYFAESCGISYEFLKLNSKSSLKQKLKPLLSYFNSYFLETCGINYEFLKLKKFWCAKSAFKLVPLKVGRFWCHFIVGLLVYSILFMLDHVSHVLELCCLSDHYKHCRICSKFILDLR